MSGAEEQQGAVQEQTMAMGEFRGRITVFTITACSFCRRAMAKLKYLGLPFVAINLDEAPHRRAEMVTRTGGKTSVPQIFFNDMHLGGMDALEEAETSGALQVFVTEVREHRAPDSAPQPQRVEREFDILDSAVETGITCETDEYAKLVRDLRSSDLIADRHYHLRLYKQCFVGRDFVDWLCNMKSISREEAVTLGGELISRKFGHHVCNDHDFKDGYFFYRLLDDDETNALNMEELSECEPRPAAEVSEILRSAIVMLYADYLSEDGRHVDYTQMENSKLFADYRILSRELQRVDITSLETDEQRIAFFINIYNALVIHAYVVRSPPKTTWERFKFFNTSSYMIGGHQYSLQDIEHGILRGNRKGPGQFKKPFNKGDPRAEAAVHEVDPRIHFALVCGAKSCPPIKTYSAETVRSELALAANSFLQDGAVVVNEAKNEIQLNRILAWYKADFGTSMKELLAFISANMGDCALKKTFDAAVAKNAKVSYLTYDWTVNGV